MTKESLYNKDCIFRETFNSKQDTRFNGGTPTDVTFKNGKGTFNGTSSKINYALGLKGTYSVRIKCNPTSFAANRYLIDVRGSNNDGAGNIFLLATTNVLTVTSGTKYVNGSAGSSVTAGEDVEIVVTGITLTEGTGANLSIIGSRYSNSSEFLGTIDLVEIYEGTLTAEQVKNLYEGKTYKEINIADTLIDFDTRNGAIEDKMVDSIVGDDLVTNGGFDTGDFTGWFEHGTIDSKSVIDNIARVTTSAINTGLRQQVITTGTNYKVIGKVRSDGIGIPRVWIGGASGHHWLGTTSTDWQYFSFNQVANGTSFYLTSGNISTSYLEWDYVVIHEVRDDLDITSTTIAKDGSYAAKFDGANSKIDTGTDMIGTKVITVMGWIKPKDSQEGGSSRIFTNKKTLLALEDSTNNERLVFSSNGSTYVGSAVQSIKWNKWQFIALTRTSAGVANFYVGDLDTAPALNGSANQASGTPVAGTTNVIIGNNDGQTKTFDGLIPKIKTVEGILSLQEITQAWSSSRGSIQ